MLSESRPDVLDKAKRKAIFDFISEHSFSSPEAHCEHKKQGWRQLRQKRFMPYMCLIIGTWAFFYHSQDIVFPKPGAAPPRRGFFHPSKRSVLGFLTAEHRFRYPERSAGSLQTNHNILC